MMNFICCSERKGWVPVIIAFSIEVKIDNFITAIKEFFEGDIISHGTFWQNTDLSDLHFVKEYSPCLSPIDTDVSNKTEVSFYQSFCVSATKYINFEGGDYANKTIVMFPENIEHRKMQKIVWSLYSMSSLVAMNPVSAGFVNFNRLSQNPSPRCFGESVGLGLKANKTEDTNILIRQLAKN